MADKKKAVTVILIGLAAIGIVVYKVFNLSFS
jgi:hypothetical protein